MDIALAKMSSKGQIVIPSNMRKDIGIGDEFLIIKDDDRFILKKISSITSSFKEDMKFAKRIDKAWKAYEKGKFKSLSASKFLEELDRC
jgi:AbrB family looped-hinge helix DNA binding protein